MRIVSLILLLLFSAALASAQRPARFVLSDSVVLFDVGSAPDPLPSLIYMTDSEGVYVCRHVNSFARIHPSPALSFSIDQIVSPLGGIKLRIGEVSPQGAEVMLRIRPPRTAYALFLNGREARFPLRGGYIEVHRTWGPQDEIWIDTNHASTSSAEEAEE